MSVLLLALERQCLYQHLIQQKANIFTSTVLQQKSTVCISIVVQKTGNVYTLTVVHQKGNVCTNTIIEQKGNVCSSIVVQQKGNICAGTGVQQKHNVCTSTVVQSVLTLQFNRKANQHCFSRKRMSILALQYNSKAVCAITEVQQKGNVYTSTGVHQKGQLGVFLSVAYIDFCKWGRQMCAVVVVNHHIPASGSSGHKYSKVSYLDSWYSILGCHKDQQMLVRRLRPQQAPSIPPSEILWQNPGQAVLDPSPLLWQKCSEYRKNFFLLKPCKNRFLTNCVLILYLNFKTSS